MESCFPPLASLSLRGSSNNSANSSSASSTSSVAASSKHQKNSNRHSLGTTGMMVSSSGDERRLHHHSDYLPKLDVIQDLDLYYIRQIACSLKVSIRLRMLRRLWEGPMINCREEDVRVSLHHPHSDLSWHLLLHCEGCAILDNYFWVALPRIVRCFL